jgi:hypothetical protein
MLDEGAGEAAISYTDQFLDAAVAKIDEVFGKGFAAANPALVQGYINSCALNLGSFMQASVALQASGELDQMILEFEEENAKPKRRK